MSFWVFKWIQVIEGRRSDITGLISSDLPPGCSHPPGSDSIWCTEPLNPFLSQQSRTDSSGSQPHLSSWSHSTNCRVKGEGVCCTDLCVQHLQNSPCCVKFQKGQDEGSRSLQPPGEQKGDLVKAGEGYFSPWSPSSEKMAVVPM